MWTKKTTLAATFLALSASYASADTPVPTCNVQHEEQQSSYSVTAAEALEALKKVPGAVLRGASRCNIVKVTVETVIEKAMEQIAEALKGPSIDKTRLAEALDLLHALKDSTAADNKILLVEVTKTAQIGAEVKEAVLQVAKDIAAMKTGMNNATNNCPAPAPAIQQAAAKLPPQPPQLVVVRVKAATNYCGGEGRYFDKTAQKCAFASDKN